MPIDSGLRQRAITQPRPAPGPRPVRTAQPPRLPPTTFAHAVSGPRCDEADEDLARGGEGHGAAGEERRASW